MLGLFKKKKKKEHRYDYLTVKELQWHGKNAATIVFEAPEDTFEYKPGQYLTIITEVDGKEERRSYSLNSSPYIDKNPAVTIKREEGGKVSGYLIDNLKPGDELKIIKPMGKFTTDFDPKNKRHLVFIGGGSGITPLYSILRSALEKEPESKVTLLYGNRDEENVIFKDKLQQLKNQYSDRFTYFHTLSQPGESWTGEKGRLDQEKLSAVLGDELKANEYFLCGPQGMMKMAEEYLKGQGCVNVFKESFVASDEIKNIKIVESAGKRKPSEVTVIDGGEEYTFTVEPDKSILETALDNGIDLPYSCQSGICTTCRCKKLEGEVEMEVSEGLTDDEIAEGYVLICVGHAKSDKVRLDLE
ncbi:MAG: 2Fe-2S iron-sulfur cluster-binding protein [Cyclobacteriaceae bacterium]